MECGTPEHFTTKKAKQNEETCMCSLAMHSLSLDEVWVGIFFERLMIFTCLLFLLLLHVVLTPFRIGGLVS